MAGRSGEPRAARRARADDDERMDELRRKVGSGKAFGTNVSMISPKQAKELFPLLNEDCIQGAGISLRFLEGHY